MIDFNVPLFMGEEIKYVMEAMNNHQISGDGCFTKKDNKWIADNLHVNHALLTTSCTHALEMAAILTKIQRGDEVIMPSFTFVSTANAFVLSGAKIVFVDIRPDTMNLDENLIKEAITEKTKAIVPVHYAGVACEMDKIMDIAKRHNLLVVEDAAHGMLATYKGRALGTLGDIGCFSFHETKNYSMGEGGAIVFHSDDFYEDAEIIREKGTNRNRFLRGQVDKYTWTDYGSSYLPSDINAAYLWGQLQQADQINENRLDIWNRYHKGLIPLAEEGRIEVPYVPNECKHNGHMYYIKAKDLEERTRLITYLKNAGIMAVFHYVPLHSSPAGIKFGRFYGEDRYTTKESERLVRLPMYYGLEAGKIDYIIDTIYSFYKQ
ncbi:MAG: dTDP-4-amino-4,6-dideoxygalactose transaminase [Lachnospiraceae bacterium]